MDEEQDRNPDQPAQSQEQPAQDSNLRTPQADQPVPRERERVADSVPTPAPDVEPPNEGVREEVREVRTETVRQESDSSE